MIDTSSTFLDQKTIKTLINGMMYNKLNVLHIHFTDDYSFPLFIENIPDLSQNSAYS